ncbi:hypothetical protein OSTOST_17612 [Ostertagia ostertagi]
MDVGRSWVVTVPSGCENILKAKESKQFLIRTKTLGFPCLTSAEKLRFLTITSDGSKLLKERRLKLKSTPSHMATLSTAVNSEGVEIKSSEDQTRTALQYFPLNFAVIKKLFWATSKLNLTSSQTSQRASLPTISAANQTN